MTGNIFIDSKLKKFGTLRLDYKRVASPSTNSELKIGASIGLRLNESKTAEGYEIRYQLGINCHEGEDKRIFFLEYEAVTIYEIACEDGSVVKEFDRCYDYFLRELYNMTRDYLNDVLIKANINFSLPLSMPEELKRNIKRG